MIAADRLDALAEAHGRQMRVIDALEFVVGEWGLAGDEVVDGLVEAGIVAGRVGVPDLEIARMRAQLQRLDLIERCFSEGERSLVLVVLLDHAKGPRLAAIPIPGRSRPSCNLGKDREGGVKRA